MADDENDKMAVLARGLQQAADLLDNLNPDVLAAPTPCEDWSIGDLADHLVAAPAKFARLVQGERMDWTAPTPQVVSGWTQQFRAGADGLMAAWRELGDREAPVDPDWQTAEIAVHTWDLATALGQVTSKLDPEVAERGIAFMQANLKPEMRSRAFRAEQPAPHDADAYERIAAFAGRQISRSR